MITASSLRSLASFRQSLCALFSFRLVVPLSTESSSYALDAIETCNDEILTKAYDAN